MISKYLILFCPLQYFPASGSFPMSQVFESNCQSVGALASASVLPMNIQDWFTSGLTGFISLQSKGLSGVFSNTTVQKHLFFGVELSLCSNSPYMITRKNIAFTIQTFVGKVMSLIFNMLPRFFIDFLPRSNFLLISWLQSPSTVILEHKKIVCNCFHCFPIYLPRSDVTGCHDLSFFECWVLIEIT